MALTCATFFCGRCRKETKFLPIHFAVAATGVSTSSTLLIRQALTKGSVHRHDLEPALPCIWKMLTGTGWSTVLITVLPVQPTSICTIRTALCWEEAV